MKCSPRNDCSCCWLDQEGIKHPTYFHISCARIAGLEVEENLEEMDDEGHPVGPYGKTVLPIAFDQRKLH